MECRQRLQDEYERIVLEETSGLELLERPSDDLVRRRASHFLVEVLGELPDPQLLDLFVENARQREYGFTSTLNRVSDQLESYIPLIIDNERKLGTFIRGPVCIAPFEFPTGPFNAHIRPLRRDGFLVLVTSGVLTLLRHVTKIMGYSTSISDAGFQYLDHARIGVFGRSPVEAVAESVSKYLGSPNPLAGAVPDLEGDQRVRMDELFNASVTFLVAHEYAHALAGHLDDPALLADLHNYSRPEEGAADWLGVKLLLSPWRWGPFDDDAAHTRLQTLLAGPLFFFALEGVIAEAERRCGRRPSLENTELGIPSPLLRKAGVLQLYTEIFGLKPFPLTNLYLDWVYRMESGVLDEVDLLLSRSPPQR